MFHKSSLSNLYLCFNLEAATTGVLAGGVLGNFVGFAGRCLCWGQPKACNSVDRETGCRCSPVGFVRFLRVPFLQSTSRQLLLLIPLSYPFLTL